MCHQEITILKKQSSAFRNPLNNSICSNLNTTINPYCSLITLIRDDVLSRFGKKIPKNYCYDYGPCIFSPPTNLSGPFCANCLSLITLIFEAKADEREKLIRNYCSSTYGSSIPFCTAIQYMIQKSMKKSFLEFNDPMKFCMDSAFCYRNKSNNGSNPKYEL